MTAIASRVLRLGHLSIVPGHPDQPDVWGHVYPAGPLHWEYYLTAAGDIVPDAGGRTWTAKGAWQAAFDAAWSPAATTAIRERAS